MTILEKIKFEEDWLSEVNLTKENVKIALAGIRAIALEQTRWIPVTERLPEKDEWVLITFDDGIEIALLDDYGWCYSSVGNDDWIAEHPPVAWMPLPQPYNAESNDEKDVNCTDLCKSCSTKGCIFQSRIARSHCDFYKAESEDKEMTEEEKAIDTLFYFKMHFAKSDICREHFDMAIKALEQQPKTGKWIEDAETYYKMLNERGLGVDEYTPYFTDDIACSVCLAKYSCIDNETQFFKYCPNCGADMRGESE